MLDSVFFFAGLSIVPVVHSAYQVAGNSSDSFEIFVAVPLSSSTGRALVVDDSRITAYRISVNRMIDGTVTYAAFLHAPYDFLKGVQVFQRIAVKLYISCLLYTSIDDILNFL